MPDRVTLKQIAEKAGVHVSTVSLALRHHPRIPAATRERVEVLAKEMGYRPDPVLSALVSYRDQKRAHAGLGVLAWVDAWPAHDNARQRFPALWAGAAARAESMGWKLEEFRLAQYGLSPERFSRMLHTRGIDGALIPPVAGESGTLNLQWQWFSPVTVGHTLGDPQLHRVTANQMNNMQLLMRKLYALGYQRPGLAIEKLVNERTHHFWMSAFLDAQYSLPKARQVPILIRTDTSPKDLLAWQKRHRPDVIVATRPVDTIDALESVGLRVPVDLGVATPAFLAEIWKQGTAWSQSGPDVAGIDERLESVGAAAIESIVAMLNRHETGVPSVPKHILLDGLWHPGKTVREMRD